ncbi:MAG: tripartite tricarboxylate transporter TctB family protein [candidate division NC10 bacterium]
MRVADLVTAAFLMLIGGAVIADAVRIGIGWGTDGPKSGFFPFWLGLIMVLMCAAIAIQALVRASRRAFVSRAQLRPVLKVLWPAVAMVVVMQWLGLYVAAAFYTGFSMRWIGRHSWLAVAAVAVGFPLVTFFIFEKWFLVPMPKGPLEAWLGY